MKIKPTKIKKEFKKECNQMKKIVSTICFLSSCLAFSGESYGTTGDELVNKTPRRPITTAGGRLDATRSRPEFDTAKTPKHRPAPPPSGARSTGGPMRPGGARGPGSESSGKERDIFAMVSAAERVTSADLNGERRPELERRLTRVHKTQIAVLPIKGLIELLREIADASQKAKTYEGLLDRGEEAPVLKEEIVHLRLSVTDLERKIADLATENSAISAHIQKLMEENSQLKRESLEARLAADVHHTVAPHYDDDYDDGRSVASGFTVGTARTARTAGTNRTFLDKGGQKASDGFLAFVENLGFDPTSYGMSPFFRKISSGPLGLGFANDTYSLEFSRPMWIHTAHFFWKAPKDTTQVCRESSRREPVITNGAQKAFEGFLKKVNYLSGEKVGHVKAIVESIAKFFVDLRDYDTKFHIVNGSDSDAIIFLPSSEVCPPCILLTCFKNPAAREAVYPKSKEYTFASSTLEEASVSGSSVHGSLHYRSLGSSRRGSVVTIGSVAATDADAGAGSGGAGGPTPRDGLAGAPGGEAAPKPE
jgi:hypothetical protein